MSPRSGYARAAAMAYLAPLTLALGSMAHAQSAGGPHTPDSASAPSGQESKVAAQVELQRPSDPAYPLPTVNQFTTGSLTIPAGTTVSTPIGVVDGTLDVFGKVEGTAMVVEGDIRVHAGGYIGGDAIAVAGRVIANEGRVDGELRSFGSLLGGAGAPIAARADEPWRSLQLVLSWFVILLAIGIGAGVFAEKNLSGVMSAVEGGVGRAFGVGLLALVLALPSLVVLVIALAITIIGLLLIPFAIVAFVLAGMGLLTLGFLAVARLTGRTLARGGAREGEGRDLGSLPLGLAAYFILWGAAAAMQNQPAIATVLRGLAFGVTAAAVTVGLGATILSRGGSRRTQRDTDASPDMEIGLGTVAPSGSIASSGAPTAGGLR